MALKQLMLAKKIEQRKSLLEELNSRGEELVQRSADLEKAVEEAETDEEVSTVEDEVNKLDEEKKEHDGKKEKLEEEISNLESELAELNDKEPQRSKQEDVKTRSQEGEKGMKVKGVETRGQMLDRLNQPEVREFYEKIREAVMQKRALSGTDLVIPQQVMDRIQPKIGDYSNLYKEVEVLQLNGTARAIVDGNIPEAIWTEMCDPVQELATAFQAVELDGFKVGGFIPVCNAILEDSMIDLANYIEDRIARAIGKALDKAILTGAGAASKQPEGIIPAVTAGAVTSDFTYADILPNVGAIDNGEDGVGEVIAVMKRQTYYNHFLPQSVATTSDGRTVVQGVNNPSIAGMRVVFSQYAPDDAVVFGDFKQYMLGERRGVSITSSTDVRFIEDQTVFKGTARYDGKPAKTGAFLLVNYAAAV